MFGFIVVAVVSLVVPAGFVVWNYCAAMTGKPFGWHTTRYMQYSSCLKDNELWCVCADPLGPGPAKLIQKCRLMRINLDTGRESETGLCADQDLLFNKQITRVGDQLYLHNSLEIHRIGKDTLEPLGHRRSSLAPYMGPPFDYDGLLTSIVASAERDFHFCHWDGDKWANGRRIVLPLTSQVWTEDPQTGRKVLLPTTSAQPLLTTRATFPDLEIKKVGAEFTLLITAANCDFAAFRQGFEVLEDDIASALAPVNSSPEASGWRPVPGITLERDHTRWQSTVLLGADSRGFYFVVHDDFRVRTSFPRLFRMRDADHFDELISEIERSPRSELRNDNILVDPEEDRAYLISWSRRETNSADIRRIEEGKIRAPHLVIRGEESRYIKRWRRIGIGLLLAWFAHNGILLAGTGWLTRRTDCVCPARLHPAPIWRRVLAFQMDVGLIGLTVSLAVWISIRDRLSQICWPTDEEWCASLHHIELLAWWYLSEGASPFDRLGLVTRWLQPFANSLPISGETRWIALIVFVAICVARIGLESLYGITPGKWLMRLRTMRSTGRPVGFSRVLVRNLLLWCDFPFLLTSLPAAFSMFLSPQRQRSGDRVADTVVISLDHPK